MTEPARPARTPWRISSYSGDSSTCVEVAGEPGVALVRNSNHPDAGTLTLSRAAMGVLTDAVKAGELDDLAI